MTIDKILAIIASLAKVTDLPHNELASDLLQIASRLIERERARTGETTAEIFAHAGVTLNEAEAKALEDLAAGV